MSTTSTITDADQASRRRSLLAYVVRSRPHRMLSGQATIWALSGAMIATAAVLFKAGASDVPPVIATVRVPFWALLIAFAAAERFVVHVHFRRSAHSMSLGEIPLVFALVFAGGEAAILAGALGRILVLALQRKLPLIRLAFNLGVFLLGNCVAVLVFHAVAGASTKITPIVWSAAILGTVANSLLAVLVISTAVSLSEGQLGIRQVARSLRTDLAVVVANTSVGLCAATIVYEDWKTAILMAIPVAGMFISFQAFVTERQRHERVEFLYRAARALSSSAEIGAALEGLLAQALDAFRAEVAEIIFFSPDGSDALRTTVRANGAATVLECVEPKIAARFRSLIEDHEGGACAAADIGDELLTRYLSARELSDGMLAVLQGERSWIGAITIGNPSGVVDRFCPEDVKLLETLANNTSVALENDRLGQTVWRLRQLQSELQHQASHDPLTDLANRSLFVQKVGEALHSDGGSVSVIFIDINDFKTVNDSLGHAAGDELLVAVARRLRDCVRPSDAVARLGGDEFAIMLDRPDSQQEAIDVTDRLNHHLAERFAIGGQNVSVHASAGIATGEGEDVSPEELIRNADLAMYRAKYQSKHRYELFESGMHASVSRQPPRARGAICADAVERERARRRPLPADRRPRAPAARPAVEALLPAGPSRRAVLSRRPSFMPLAEETGADRPDRARRCSSERAARRAACGRVGPTGLPRGAVARQRLAASSCTAATTSSTRIRQRRWQTAGLEPHWLVLEITESVLLARSGRCSMRHLARAARASECSWRSTTSAPGTHRCAISGRFPIDCAEDRDAVHGQPRAGRVGPRVHPDGARPRGQPRPRGRGGGNRVRGAACVAPRARLRVRPRLLSRITDDAQSARGCTQWTVIR